MEFRYTGQEKLNIRIPGEQYTRTILPSRNFQRTNDEVLFEFLFSAQNPHRWLFEKKQEFTFRLNETPEIPEVDE